MDLVARAARVERLGLLDEKNGLVKELSKVEAELAGLSSLLWPSDWWLFRRAPRSVHGRDVWAIGNR